MNKCLGYLFFFLAAISTTPSFAYPPKVVYRVDSRGPDKIFKHGFTAWGNNLELLPHIVGDTPKSKTDGFISTTENVNSARQIAADIMPYDDDVTWLYEIVPNDNFYDVNRSLLQAGSVHPVNSAIAEQSINAFIRYGEQYEYVSAAPINRSQIIRAREVRWVDGQIEMHNTTVEENPHFVHTAPSVNPGYLTLTQNVTDLPANFFGEYQSSLTGLSFGPDSCNSLKRKGAICKSVSYSVFKKDTTEEIRKRLLVVLKNY